ncbi:MAG: ABC transporter ATP-binding protein [Elusimicrobia bacterium]|nr:ABC transporter ATP-binding protein [Elusimicrobiota bacterium]
MFLKKFEKQQILLFLGAMALIGLPLLVENTSWAFLIRILGVMGIYVLLALGVNMVLGYVGLLDLGFMAFYAIGAYTTALLSLLGWSFWICLPASVLVAVAARAALGAPVLRLRGDYLAIVTLGFGEITRIVLNNWDGLTNGPRGISLLSSMEVVPVSVFGFPLVTNLHFYYLILFFVCAGLAVCRRLDRSRIGRAWLAIRDNELAAEATGIHVTRLKILAFMLSAGFAGVAGSIFARWENFVTPESFTFWESALLVAMVVSGGMGSLPGIVLGVVLIVGLPEVLRSDLFQRLGGTNIINARYLLFGAILMGMVIFRPQGLWPRRRTKFPERETA